MGKFVRMERRMRLINPITLRKKIQKLRERVIARETKIRSRASETIQGKIAMSLYDTSKITGMRFKHVLIVFALSIISVVYLLYRTFWHNKSKKKGK